MALNKNNLIVGAGRIFMAPVDEPLPAFASGTRYKDTMAGPNSGWVDLGFTTDGVEVAYDPTYTDITVDQYKDAAKVFLDTETMSFGTTLQEATLENLAVAWGREQGADIEYAPDRKTFTIRPGGDVACEYSLVVVGPAPGTEVDCSPEGGSTVIDRVYQAYRVISVDGSTHTLARTDATGFPVSFRCLPHEVPTDVDTGATESRYAQVIDYAVQATEVPWADRLAP